MKRQKRKYRIMKHNADRFVPRKPFSFRLPPRSHKRKRWRDLCDLLKRPGENGYAALTGRTFFLENCNKLGVSVSCFTQSICPTFVQVEHQNRTINPDIQNRLPKVKKFVFSPVRISVFEHGRPLSLVERRRNYYGDKVYRKDLKKAKRIVRSTAENVEYDNHAPHCHTSYHTCEAAVELKQTISLHGEVVLADYVLINNSPTKRKLTIDFSDRRGIGIEESLGTSPPRVICRRDGMVVMQQYPDWPVAGMNVIVANPFGRQWKLSRNDNQKSFHTRCTREFKPHEKFHFSVLCALGFGRTELVAQIGKFTKAPPNLVACAARDWNRYLNNIVPAFTCSNTNVEKLYYWSFFNQKFNTEDFYWDRSNTPHICPRRGNYAGAHWWDSTFHAIIAKWLNDPGLAWNSIELTHDDSSWYHTTSALGLWDYLCRDPRPEVLDDVLQKMERIDKRFHGDFRNHRLLPSIDEKIWDYPYRWEPFYDGDRGRLKGYCELVDRSAMVTYHQLVMSRMYGLRGDKAKASEFHARYLKMKQTINRRLWNKATGFYHDVIEQTGKHFSCKPCAGFRTMLAGIPDRKRFASLRRHLTDPNEFGTPMRVPTISRSSAGFTPVGYWHGNIWAPTNWMIIEGLVNYDEQLATELIHEWIHYATCDGYPTTCEWYSSFGRPGGHTIQGWSGLIADLIIRHVMGVVLRPDDKLEFHPFAINRSWQYATLENFHYGTHVIGVRWERKPKDRYSIFVDGKRVCSTDGTRRVVLEQGKTGWRRMMS